MKKIDITVVDDHTLVRNGVCKLLKTFKRIGRIHEASGGKELLGMLEKNVPHVALLDINMPDMDGFVLSEKLVSTYPNLKIIIVSMRDDDASIARMIEIGVHGYLLKNTDADEFESTIYSVVDNGHHHNSLVFSVVKKIMQGKMVKQELPVSVSLTVREAEVLTLICQELSYKEISDRLFISEKTIHNHRNHIMEKIGAKNTIGLVKFAYLNGYITWPNEVQIA